MTSADLEMRIRAGRERQISAVFKRRFGIIDGVEIDLRHPDLESSTWFPPVFDNVPVRPADAPFIWFPWFGKFDPDALEEEARSVVMRGPKRSLAQSHSRNQKGGSRNEPKSIQPLPTIEERIKAFIEDRTPECTVLEGDKITVARVDTKIVGAALDHPHDREVRLAYLRIHRAEGGDPVKLPTPLIYTGMTTVLDSDISNTNFGLMLERIMKKFKIASIHDTPLVQKPSDPEEQLAYRALRRAFSIASENNDESFGTESSNGTVNIRSTSEDIHDGSNVWYTINDALMMGYLCAKWEMDPAVRAHAEDELKKKVTKDKNSKKRGDARGEAGTRVSAERQAIVDKIAEAMLAQNAACKQADIVRIINHDVEKWEDARDALGLRKALTRPEWGTIKTHVSNFFKRRFGKTLVSGQKAK
jgi:hypothetical protein